MVSKFRISPQVLSMVCGGSPHVLIHSVGTCPNMPQTVNWDIKHELDDWIGVQTL